MRIGPVEMRKWWVRWGRDEGELRSVNREAAVFRSSFHPQIVAGDEVMGENCGLCSLWRILGSQQATEKEGGYWIKSTFDYLRANTSWII